MQAHTTTTARTNNFMPRLEKPDRIQLVKAYVKTVLNLSYYNYYIFRSYSCTYFFSPVCKWNLFIINQNSLKTKLNLFIFLSSGIGSRLGTSFQLNNGTLLLICFLTIAFPPNARIYFCVKFFLVVKNKILSTY